jgi:hypothetical protein
MDDYLALGLAGREGQALLGQLRAGVPRPYLLAFSRWMCVRVRFAEDIVEQCRPGTRVVLSYNQPPTALAGSTAQIAAAFAGLAAERGEPFISRFLPGEMTRLLHEHGFGQITDFGPDEARAAYFREGADVEIAGAQPLVVADGTTAAGDPGQGAPGDPAAGQDVEGVQIAGAPDD